MNKIFQKAIQEQGGGQIMNTLAEIQERHDAIRDLERKLLDLQQWLKKSTRKVLFISSEKIKKVKAGAFKVPQQSAGIFSSES
ncbi:hypothetical protein DVH24_034614 [Malus domestica]|uniref:Uncharacterized protein n=1 Tax=Malus domestica TaxID=3750 RepID=A0A498J030_MALDO|nr:hypothetical protein DVH24_034614 [Malus domestica]